MPQAPTQQEAGSAPVPGRSWLMLALATVGFAVNFWAWALLSPLGPRFKDSLGLSSFEQSLLVAVPVVVGSLGRIPVGALTDRFGGRVMFPLVSAASIVPVLYLGLAGHSSLAALLVGGFLLGIGGTAFAVGVPLINAWFPPERRGFAIGIFGMGIDELHRDQRADHGEARQCPWHVHPRATSPAPNIVYRSRDIGLGARAPRRGWERVG